jgi:putative phosphoesterase
MKVLVMSDTHGDIFNARQAIVSNADIDLVLHLGDFYRDAVKLSQLFPDIKMEYVCGNCDTGIAAPYAEKILEIGGKRIFMTHGHKYSVKWSYDRILAKAEEENADVILFGHTHIAFIDKINNILIINPGSISESRSSNFESYLIMEIMGDTIKTNLHYV